MRRLIFLLISATLLSACHLGMRKDDSSLSKGIKVFRYDRLQYEATALNSIGSLQRMKLEYSQATKLLVEDVLALGRVNDENINDRLITYYSDTTLLRLMEDALLKYSDMSAIEKGLSEGFATLKEEVPSLVVPAIYSQISALNQSVVIGDSLLGFSIDKYMGEDYPIYKRYYYAYQRRTMTPDRILPDCFVSYLFSQYPFRWQMGDRSLYNVILHRGRIHWVAAYAMGLSTKADILSYNRQEKAWCRKEGEKLWQWMSSNHLLESTDPMVIRAFTRSDPTGLFGREDVPPMIGVWIGIKLIDKYMSEHPKTTIAELLECNDFGRIELD